MATTAQQWRHRVATFFDEVPARIAAGDPRFTFVGSFTEVRLQIPRRAAAARERAWTTHVALGFTEARQALAEVGDPTSREVDLRDLVSPLVVRSFPLLASLAPGLRVGWVPSPLFLRDGTQALLPGPDDAELGGTVWETTDPEIVAGLECVFRRCWEDAVPIQEASDRAPLPPRRLAVALGLADGASDREIAATLGTSIRTVTAEVRAVVDWCGARSRSHAIAVLVGAEL